MPLSSTPPVPLAELEAELLGLAGHIAAAQSQFLTLLAEFDDRGGWAGPGLRSCAHWLSWRAGMSLRTATEHVRVAHALTHLPLVAAAFAEGTVSYSKVRAITRVAVPDAGAGSPTGAVERERPRPAEGGAAAQGSSEREEAAARPAARADAVSISAERDTDAPGCSEREGTAARSAERAAPVPDARGRAAAGPGSAEHEGNAVRSAERAGPVPSAGGRGADAPDSWERELAAVRSAEHGTGTGTARAAVVGSAGSEPAAAGGGGHRPEGPTSEKVLLDLALAGTASHVERVVRAARRLAAGAEVQTARRSVSWRWDEDGMLVLRARLDPAAGAALLATLEEATGPTSSRRSHDDPPAPPDVLERGAEEAPGAAADSTAARRADALVELVTRETGAGPSVARGRAEFVVHVDVNGAGVNAAGTALGGAALGGPSGPELPSATARRLACDARARVLLSGTRDGRLYLGRRRRLATPAQIAALTVRDDGRCRFPGCTHQRYLHAHHVRSWLDGGRTDLDNLVLLCGFHHRLVHDRGYGIRADGAAWRFSRPDGTPVPPAGAPLHGSARDLVESHVRAGLRIGPGTLTPSWFGERLDPNPILEVLVPALRTARAA